MEANYCGPYKTYSDYNYRRSGLINWIKTQHFRAALRLSIGGRHWRAMDFGCADGYFLPALASQFRIVSGVDKRAEWLDQCPELPNVLLSSTIGTDSYDVIFALETLEHIADRLGTLRLLRDRLNPHGKIIASVPIMIGLTFLIQRLGLWLTRSHREPMTYGEIARSAVGITDRLRWEGGHVGFNHREFEDGMTQAGMRFDRNRLLFQYIYVIYGD